MHLSFRKLKEGAMTTQQKRGLKSFGAFRAAILLTFCVLASAQMVKIPSDPGVRGGAAGAGTPLRGLMRTTAHSLETGLPGSLTSKS
jgi:hypothetical protein